MDETKEAHALVLSLVGLAVLLGIGLLTTLRVANDRADLVTTLRRQHARTERERARAVAERDALAELALRRELDDLEQAADVLWPCRPEHLEAFGLWLHRAEELLARRDRLEAALDAEAGEASPPSRVDRWRRGELVRLLRDLGELADPSDGLIAGISPRWGWGVARRRAFAARLAERAFDDDGAAVPWDEAREAIASHPAYGGLELARPVDLVPVGPDPESGLWEFAHPQTGSVPERGTGGRLVVTGATGLVLVLVPGGRTRLGAQSEHPGEPHHDPQAGAGEGPVRTLEVAPFLIAKHELTQGQWRRVTGDDPATHPMATATVPAVAPPPGGVPASDARAHPVETVSATEARLVLGRLGLRLPTEAEWEHAARAGTDAPWWTGPDPSGLAAARVRLRLPGGGPDDVHERVDRGPANGFGLLHVQGNVREWCRAGVGGAATVARGGGFRSEPFRARFTHREVLSPGTRADDLGLRPARSLEIAP